MITPILTLNARVTPIGIWIERKVRNFKDIGAEFWTEKIAIPLTHNARIILLRIGEMNFCIKFSLRHKMTNYKLIMNYKLKQEEARSKKEKL